MGRILYFQWHSFMNAGMERALQKLEIAYDTFYMKTTGITSNFYAGFCASGFTFCALYGMM